MDGYRTDRGSVSGPARSERRQQPRVPVGTTAIVHQPSLRSEPFEVVAANVSLTGAFFTAGSLFRDRDFLHCRVVFPGSGAVAGTEVRLSAVVVRLEDDRRENDGRYGVGAFFVGLDARDEQTIRDYVLRARSARPAPTDPT